MSRRTFVPTRDERVDLVGAGLVLLLGILGFRSAFGGSDYLVAGIGGILLGLAAGYAIVVLQLRLVLATVTLVGGFLLLGGPLALGGAGAGLLPTPAVMRKLVDGLVNGWARLVTTVAPTGSSGNLLVVPFVTGHLGASLTVLAARKVGRAPLWIVPPLAVLALSIVVGTDKPAALVLQGGAFFVVSVVWAVDRSRRGSSQSPWKLSPGRAAGAGALLLSAAVGGLVLGPLLPLAGGRDRFVLRDETDPPFDPRAFASPLVGYRAFLDPVRRDDVLFRTEGLPPGSWLRWAVLDQYDGLVWAAGAGTSGLGRYQRVGDHIDAGSPGRSVSVAVTIEDFSTVWLPLAGPLERIEFTGQRGADIADSFRYNGEAVAAATPVPLRSGDGFRATVRLPAEQPSLLTLDETLRGASVDASVGIGPTAEVPAALQAIVNRQTSSEVGAFAKTASLLSYFQQGFYSDGDIEGRTDPPGHYLLRLAQFVGAEGRPVGNAEQYASAMALLLRSLHIPARVVIGFKPGDDGAVRAGSIDGWVEVAFEGVGWVRVDPTPPRSQRPDPEPPPKEVAENEQPEAPPPTSIPPRPSIPDAQTDDLEESEPDKSDSRSLLALLSGILAIAVRAAIPLAALAGPPLLIVGAKRRRRKRRRTQGTPAIRIAGGWLEVLDIVRDTGRSVPVQETRHEVSRLLADRVPADLAERADTASFGPEDPVPADAETYWRLVDEVRAQALGRLSRGRRVRAHLSLASVRRADRLRARTEAARRSVNA